MDMLGRNPVHQDPAAAPLPASRRRVRQKVHSPAYARLNGDSSQVLDLSEIVDISEDGMAIQSSYPFEKQRWVNLCLDLTATKATIYTTAEVIWTDHSGRVGIRFPQMSDSTLRPLKEWLFLNAMVAGVNHRAEQLSAIPVFPEKQENGSALVDWMRQEVESAAPPDYTSILAGLTAVTREAAALGPDLDGVLQLIADRAHSFTRATGAAIALTMGADMVCRASIGSDAPSLGARLTIGSGFSGECVRTGRLLRCEDSETDRLVDRESCRALGIRSMIAVPIRGDDAVIGLLEVFSPTPFAFSPNDDLVLQRLAKIASATVLRCGSPKVGSQLAVGELPVTLDAHAQEDAGPVATTLIAEPVVDDEFPVETAADLPLPRFSRSRKLLLLASAATILVAMSWVISPSDLDRMGSLRPSSPPPAPAPVPQVASVAPVSGAESMQKLAEQGDPAAQFAVGAHYATGEGVPQNYSEAIRWFSLAAEQGHIVSQATLGAYYWAGQGVPQDLAKAYYWSVLARAGGDEASKYRVAVLASRMPHAQVVIVQQQADDWLKQHRSISQNTQP